MSSPAATTSAATRLFNTWFQLSDQRTARVAYSIVINSAATLLAGATGRVILEISPTNTGTTPLTLDTGQSGLSAGLVNPGSNGTIKLTGVVPVTYYARLRPIAVEGTATYFSNDGSTANSGLGTNTANSGFGTETLYD